MKTGIIIGAIVVVLAIIFGFTAWGTYSGLIDKRNDAQIRAWANVQAAYQRRFDTIPKFAKNAQFSAQFQIKLATDLAKAREGTKDAAATGQPEALQAAVNKGFDGLMIAVRAEAVTEAKTDQLTELNAEIENVERVINHERTVYNEKVTTYMTAIQQPLGATFISWFGWSDKFPALEAFKAQEGAEKSPEYELKLD